MINVKGVVIRFSEPDTCQRSITAPPPRATRWELPMPLTLVRYAVEEGTGKPMDELQLAGAIEELTIVGTDLHFRGHLDRTTEAGAKLASYLAKSGSVAVAPYLEDVAHAMFDLDTMVASDLLAPTEILDWRLRAVHVVHEQYAAWPEARMHLDLVA